jgi:uncharacterized membrane protein
MTESSLQEQSPGKTPLRAWLARIAVLALGVALIILAAAATNHPDLFTSLTPLLSDPHAAAYKFRAAALSLGLWCLFVLATPYLAGRRLSFSARLGGSRPWLVVLFLVSVYVVAYSFFTINRHDQFNSHCFDLGIMDQVVWNTSQGRPFASSIEVSNFLGDHVQPLLALWAPLYWVYPRVEVLLVVQTVVLALGAFPVYWLARHYLNDVVAGWTFAGLYLAYPPLGFVNRFDFHNEFVVVPLLLLCFVAIANRNTWLLSLTLALALLGKEETGLTVAFVGLYLVLFVKEYRKLGAFWAVAGVAYSFIALFVIIPYLRNYPSDTLARYGWLGQAPLQMLGTLLTRPLYVIEGVPLLLLLWYLFQMTMPLAFSPIFSPQTLLLALPALAYNFLSANVAQHDIYLHYMTIQIPVFFISAIFGTQRLVERGLIERLVSFMFPQSRGKVAPLPLILLPMVGLTLVSFMTNNPFTEQLIEPFNLVELDNAQSVRRAIALIPPDSSVLAASAYVPHLSQRQKVFMYPSVSISGTQAEYFLFNLHDARYLHTRPPDWHSEELAWAARHGYGVVFTENGVYLLKKGGGTPLDEQALYEMRQEAETWGVLQQ